MVKLKDITLLKDFTDVTSEQLFDIVPQLDMQCPKIDGMIRDANYMVNDIRSVVKYYEEDNGHLIEQLEDASTYISYLEDEFEGLRDSIIEIRAWGQEWKNLAKYLMESMEVDEVLELTNLDYDEQERVKNSLIKQVTH